MDYFMAGCKPDGCVMPKKHRILYLVGQLGKGGAEKQLYELVKGIDKDRFDPIVVSLSRGGYWADKIRKLGIELIELPRKKHVEFGRLFKLIKIFREKKPVIVHTYMYSANSYGRIAALLTRVPIVLASERSCIEIGKDKNRYQIYLDKLLTFFTSGIICNSLNASESLIKRYSFNRNKIFTIHNGIDSDTFSKKIDFDNQKKLAKKVVGAIGNLTHPKNHGLFLDVAKIVLEELEDEDLRFLIIGEGPLKDELKKYSQDLGIDGKVIFTGSRDDIPSLLQMMDVFVLTSNWEGLSNAIMEAMVSGLPCVVTDVGGNSELVVNGETGYVVPPNDPETMAQKVLCLFKNEKMRKEMGMAGRRRIEKDFSVDKMVGETAEVYEKLLFKD